MENEILKIQLKDFLKFTVSCPEFKVVKVVQ